MPDGVKTKLCCVWFGSKQQNELLRFLIGLACDFLSPFLQPLACELDTSKHDSISDWSLSMRLGMYSRWRLQYCWFSGALPSTHAKSAFDLCQLHRQFSERCSETDIQFYKRQRGLHLEYAIWKLLQLAMSWYLSVGQLCFSLGPCRAQTGRDSSKSSAKVGGSSNSSAPNIYPIEKG